MNEKEIKKILFADFKEGKAVCPCGCGGKIFLEYGGARKAEKNSALRCTRCLNDYVFNDVDAFEEVDFMKHKIAKFLDYHENPNTKTT